jgi:osmoprotectant transport system permease protein
LSEILARHVSHETGARVTTIQSLGSTVAFDALVAGDIDAYVDYSGTIWATLMNRSDVPADREEVLREVRAWLEREHGIVVAAALGFENTYALALRRDRAEELGAVRISELGPHAGRLSIGGDFEFFQRRAWRSIREVYGLAFAEERSMDPSLMYQAVDRRSVDVIGAYSTDGRIAALDLAVLDDDRGAIPPYDALVLCGPRLARERPDVIAAMTALDGALDARAMRALNARVDRDGETPERVAAGWLAAR